MGLLFSSLSSYQYKSLRRRSFPRFIIPFEVHYMYAVAAKRTSGLHSDDGATLGIDLFNTLGPFPINSVLIFLRSSAYF